MNFIYIFLLNFVPLLSISNHNKNVLPPINNIYKTTLYIPLLGKQNIEYERVDTLVSQISLYGRVNAIGYINFDKTNILNYNFDDTLTKIVQKYRCTIYNPYYDKVNDIINFKIKINIIQFQKTLILKNIKTIENKNSINCIT